MILASTADGDGIEPSRRHFVPPVLTTSGNLREARGFAMQRSGMGADAAWI